MDVVWSVVTKAHAREELRYRITHIRASFSLPLSSLSRPFHIFRPWPSIHPPVHRASWEGIDGRPGIALGGWLAGRPLPAPGRADGARNGWSPRKRLPNRGPNTRSHAGGLVSSVCSACSACYGGGEELGWLRIVFHSTPLPMPWCPCSSIQAGLSILFSIKT